MLNCENLDFTETLKYVNDNSYVKNMDQIEGGLYMIKLYENGVIFSMELR